MLGPQCPPYQRCCRGTLEYCCGKDECTKPGSSRWRDEMEPMLGTVGVAHTTSCLGQSSNPSPQALPCPCQQGRTHMLPNKIYSQVQRTLAWTLLILLRRKAVRRRVSTTGRRLKCLKFLVDLVVLSAGLAKRKVSQWQRVLEKSSNYQLQLRLTVTILFLTYRSSPFGAPFDNLSRSC